MPDIELKNVSKYYRGDRRREIALSEVNLTIKQGEFVFFVGSSGAGKSTLLRVISGEEKPGWGTVSIGGKEVQNLRLFSRNRSALLFGKVWQEPHFVRKKTVGQNLALAAVIGSVPRPLGKRTIMKRVNKVLGIVGMQGVADKYPVELSGGEARRVELARALINSPPILILDEITANLDDDNIWDMMHLLNEINMRGTTVLMATHASRYVNVMCRRVVTLVDGRIYGDVKRGKYGVFH